MNKNISDLPNEEFLQVLHDRIISGRAKSSDPVIKENPGLTPERAVTGYCRTLLDSPQTVDNIRYN